MIDDLHALHSCIYALRFGQRSLHKLDAKTREFLRAPITSPYHTTDAVAILHERRCEVGTDPARDTRDEDVSQGVPPHEAGHLGRNRHGS